MTLRLDHLVVLAPALGAGIAWMRERIGRPPGSGGKHERMGTHNACWRLGDAYLEVLAVDPDAPRPDRPRWFGFDDPTVRGALEGGPFLASWAISGSPEDLEALAERAPVPVDPPVEFERDGLRWLALLPQEEALPLGGAWPLAISWLDGAHPVRAMEDRGMWIERVEISGAGAGAAQTALGDLGGRVVFAPSGSTPLVKALISTPRGDVML